jgi:hypothetical protein
LKEKKMERANSQQRPLYVAKRSPTRVGKIPGVISAGASAAATSVFVNVYLTSESGFVSEPANRTLEVGMKGTEINAPDV